MERTQINPKDIKDEAGEPLKLSDGSRVAVVGGGPAGSLFTYFLLDMAERVGLELDLTLYEPRDFWGVGAASCNMCGGIISESLVQNLAADGINLPTTVVQRAIDSYVLHIKEGSVRIDTPANEMRIAAVYRAAGPRGVENIEYASFDGFLQMLAVKKGAFLIGDKVTDIKFDNGRPLIKRKEGPDTNFDLVVVAAGVNTQLLKTFQEPPLNYVSPETTRTFIREYHFGKEITSEHVGSSMHVFLLDIPQLEFAAVIPKGNHVSACMLGEKIDKNMLDHFLGSDAVKECMPPNWTPAESPCQCSPRMNTRGATRPFADRLLFIGDSGVSRLYKDGIGAAYRTAKAAARTVIFQGISESDFEKHYWPTCRAIENDNNIGRWVFGVSTLIKKMSFARRAMLRMARNEQTKKSTQRRMSRVLWDLFTGSAPYRDILLRCFHPSFLAGLIWHMCRSIVVRPSRDLRISEDLERSKS